MLVELNIVPLERGAHLGDAIAEVVGIVNDSGLPYQLTPSGTCIEGDWDQVMPIVRRCHEQARQRSPHVMTTVHIEDEEGARDKLRANVSSVEERLGHSAERLVME
jgi:uncharacterized protein (TIGR00106 family)